MEIPHLEYNSNIRCIEIQTDNQNQPVYHGITVTLDVLKSFMKTEYNEEGVV